MIDYAALDSRRSARTGTSSTPSCRPGSRRDCPAEDREWADAKLHELRRARRHAHRPQRRHHRRRTRPQLVRYDRWANEVDKVVHHPATLDSKRALWRVRATCRASPPTKRARAARPPASSCAGAQLPALPGRHRPGVQPRHDERRRRPGRRLRAARRARPACSPGCGPTTSKPASTGRCSSPSATAGPTSGRTVHCTARDIGDGRVLIDGEKWFCSNIDGAAIVLLARPEGAPDGPAGLGLYLVPRHLEDGSPQRLSRCAGSRPKLGTKSVPTGEVEFHGALGYALRAHGRRRRDSASPTPAGSTA